MKNKSTSLLLAVLASVSLMGCSNAKEQLGLTRSAPDEFAVVKRAPLEMPPDYALRPPMPGAARPQEQTPTDQARATVFGGESDARKAPPANGEAALLAEAGADNTDPQIRRVVDRESGIEDDSKKPVVERLFGIKRPGSKDPNVIDPKEEAERLKRHSAVVGNE
ncbi:MAG TPA: DUF3035 domain-containing protein [Micavibrio sp.]